MLSGPNSSRALGLAPVTWVVECLNGLVVWTVGVRGLVDDVGRVLPTQLRLVSSTGDLVQVFHG